MMVREAWIFSGAAASIAGRSGLRGVSSSAFVFARADDLGDQLVGLFVEQQDDAAVGLDVLEDQVHDHFQHLIDVEAAAQRGAELVENLEIGHRRGGGLGDGQHHRIFAARRRCA